MRGDNGLLQSDRRRAGLIYYFSFTRSVETSRIKTATMRRLCTVFAMAIVGTSRLSAEPIAWTGAAGNRSWHTAGNWDLNRLPNSADDVTVGLSGTYTVTVTGSASALSVLVGGAGATPTLQLQPGSTLAVGSNVTVLASAVLELQRDAVIGTALLNLAPSGGTLINQGVVNVTGAAGNCHLQGSIDNQGTINVLGPTLNIGYGSACTATNSGTITISGGGFKPNNNGAMQFNNTGSVSVGAGCSFSHANAALNLNSGTFGGNGTLTLLNSTVYLSADFHSADWGSLSLTATTFNGPGTFINDKPGGFSPYVVTFNAPMSNLTTLTPYGCTFNGGLVNPAGSTLRLQADLSYTQNLVSNGFTNQGLIELIGVSATLKVQGTLVNAPTGQIVARRDGDSFLTRTLDATVLNNQGTITSVDVADLRIGGGNASLSLNNSGTINIQSGSLSNWDGFNAANNLTVTNSGAVNFAPGTLYRQRLGTLNLNGGSFGGTGANLDIRTLTVNLGADVHTADWNGLYIEQCTFNGPGTFVNDHPVGFTATSTEGGYQSVFNTLVDNRTVFTSHGCLFSAGFLNPLGARLLIRYRTLANNITHFLTPITNHGVIEIIDPGAGINAYIPHPNFEVLTLTNSPTGRIHVHRLDTAQAGTRFLGSNINNLGEFTIHDVNLDMGVGNAFTHIWNHGTFNVLGGDLFFPNGPLNEARIENHGLFHIGVDRNINNGSAYYGGNNPPFNFLNFSDGILSGSGTIFGPVEAGGIIRPGGEGVVGTLSITGLVTVPGDAFLIGAAFEFDVGAPGPQPHDVLSASVVAPGTTGARVLSVNILGHNLPPPGEAVSVNGGPFIESNLPVSDGVVCVGCFGGGVGTSCGGLITVLETGCAGPSITQQPQSIALCPGDTATLSVVASGAAPLTYQWKRLGTSLVDGPTGTGATIAGANGPALTITNITDNEFGAYTVTISDANGTRICDPVTISAASIMVTDATTQGYLDSLTTIEGSLLMINEDNRPTLIVPNLLSVDCEVRVSDNATLASIQAPLLATVGRNVRVQNNPLLTQLSMPGLIVVDGDVEVSNNPLLDVIELPSLGVAAGSVDITNNDGAETIDLGGLVGVGGDVTITGYAQLFLDTLYIAGGDVTLEASGDIDLAGAAIGGNIDISTVDASSIDIAAPGGTIAIKMSNDGASVDADIADNAVPADTAIGVVRLDPGTLGPVDGLDPLGAPVSLDPIAAYDFGIGGALSAPASLVFELTLADLAPADQTAVLDAYVAGQLTMSVQGDAPGSVPQARAVCAPNDPLVPDGCVRVNAFNAQGAQLPPGVITGAVRLRVASQVSHFSTYSVAIVLGAPIMAGNCNCDDAITAEDIDAFVLMMCDAEEYAKQYPGCTERSGDMNGDRKTDGLDIKLFVEALLGAKR